MSGLVFVVDAQGQPLMPLAEAHARKLLRGGKAQFHPHHALTIIQLNRVVPHPILRPIAVGIVPHRATTELFLVTEEPRDIFPLLYVVVDLSTHLISQQSGLVGEQVQARVLDVGAAIAAFRLFVPISHVLIFHSDGHTDNKLDMTQQLASYLMSDELHVSIAHRDSNVPSGLSPNLWHYLVRFATQPVMSALVAVPFAPPDPEAQLQQRYNPTRDILTPSIGVVGNPPIIGFLHASPKNNMFELDMPTAVGPTRVVWERVIVGPPASVQSWPVGTVGLLPIATLIDQPGITRWDDYFCDQRRTFFS